MMFFTLEFVFTVYSQWIPDLIPFMLFVAHYECFAANEPKGKKSSIRDFLYIHSVLGISV